MASRRACGPSSAPVERAAAPLRQELRAQARATVRFETRPGRRLQIDFGERRVEIAGRSEKVFFFVATPGCSRRLHVRAFRGERQEHRFAGIESAFAGFGGVPEEAPRDNARALIRRHDPVPHEAAATPELQAFARRRGFAAKACAPCRARTKGEDERGAGCVEKNAVAGRRFDGFAALEAHLAAWTRDIADLRAHGATGEAPRLRVERDEARRLRGLAGGPPCLSSRDLVRKGSSDRSVEVDGDAYSAPWRLIGESVAATVAGPELRAAPAGQEGARRMRRAGRHGRVADPTRFAGVGRRKAAPAPTGPAAPLRPLSEDDSVAGGAWR